MNKNTVNASLKSRIKNLTLAVSLSSALFSVLNFPTAADISVTALPLALIFTIFVYYFSYCALFVRNDAKYISVVRELFQYLPYVLLISFVLRRAGKNGASFFLDFISVVLWLVTCGLSIYVLHYLNPKRIEKIDSEWKKYTLSLAAKLKRGVKGFFMEVLSWLDALLQAVFMVLLLNIFIVQLYEIPSESMVPEFLVGDRVVVFKTASGPKFPLSDVGLPYIKSYDRGDIVVFRNPHYSNDRKSEVKTFLSQLVYMCSLTTVNLNVDENGFPKADPLVKRVVALPGEQIVMQDGILYSRTKENPEWRVVEDDKKWACWNLNEVKPSLKEKIHDFPVENDIFDSLLTVEENRNSFSIENAVSECRKIASEFDSAFNLFASGRHISPSALGSFFDENNMYEYRLFSNHSYYVSKILTSSDGKAWFRNFMTDWTSSVKTDFEGDIYAEANYKLNLMIKLCLGKIFVRDAELFARGVSSNSIRNDAEIQKYMEEAEMLNSYVFYLDRRNMPVFPSSQNGEAQFIPANSYFVMGDNRFNSLDMRHSYEEKMTKLTELDRYSVTYYSNMAPQYISKSRILGETSYRFWPFARHGIPGSTGM